MTLGTDTSDFQTIVSPSAYKQSGRSFLIRKLGEGLKGPGDHIGADNALLDISRLKAAGVDCAGYWFVQPNLDGTAQAQMAGGIARAAGLKGIACDCEVPDNEPWNQIASVMHAFLGAIAAQGFSNLLYDNRTWIDTLSAEQWGIPIWYANPSVLMPDRGCVNWQCGQGSVPGISGTVDLDNWTGNQSTYDLFFNGSQPAPIKEQPSMFCTDPTTGGTWSTDANGDVFAEFGAPAIPGLNTHPEWQAGSNESGGKNPVVGIAAVKDAHGAWGIVFFTFNWQNAPDGSPYHTYRINRDGTPG